MNDAGTVTQFIEALQLLNGNAASLASTLSSIQQSLLARPKLAKPPRQPKAAEPEKTPEEEEEEWWESTRATSAVSKILGGGVSSTSILHDMRELENKINDVVQAQKLGIISTRDAVMTVAGLGKDYAELATVAAGKTLGGQAGAKIVQAATSAPKDAYGFGMSQIMGIGTGLMGLLGGTALGGGLFGLLMAGIKEGDRLAAEAGEIVNVFSAAGMSASRGAIGHFAAFQETAQKFYGIARQEVQGVLKEFLLAGVTIEEVMEGGKRGMGEVGHDAVTLTLAMDKMFELSSGFTAQQAMQVVQNQGLGVGDAVDRIMRVEMLAHRAATSVSEFTNDSVQVSNELRDYGVRVDSAASVMSTLQDRFKDIGLNSQTAMEYATQGAKEISGGLKGASLGIQVLLAEQLGLGSDMSARYKLVDSLSNGKERDFAEIVRGLHRVAKTQTKGTYGGNDEVREREYLERQGFGIIGAKSVVTIGEKLDQGYGIDAISKQEWTDIRKAFQVEGTKISDLQKQSAKIMKSLANLGQSILITVTSFMALMIISIKTLLAVDWKLTIVSGMVKATLGDTAGRIVQSVGEAMSLNDARIVDSDAVMAKFHESWKATTQAAGKVYSSVSDTTTAMREVIEPMMKPIFMVLEYDDGSDSGISGKAGLTPTFWREFDEMCRRLGVEPKELKKVIMAETGWDPEKVNYVIDAKGNPMLNAQGEKIKQAAGLGSWLHSTAISMAGMTEEQWKNIEKMSPMEQLPFLERTFRKFGVKGLTAEQIHVKQFGTGYLRTNPPLPGGGAMYIGKKWWTSPEGAAWLAEHPDYKPRALAQYNLYMQNRALDKDDKGYISREDVWATTMVCPSCGKVYYHCRCPLVSVSKAVVHRTSSGPRVVVSLLVRDQQTAVAMPRVLGPSFTGTDLTAPEQQLPSDMVLTLKNMGIMEDHKDDTCNPSLETCLPPATPASSEASYSEGETE